jgi:hypothetical protein
VICKRLFGRSAKKIREQVTTIVGNFGGFKVFRFEINFFFIGWSDFEQTNPIARNSLLKNFSPCSKNLPNILNDAI